ncbi:aldehyde dehydrogenase family protein [Alphaproteobacteria bacterium]|jgi:acyl-CoA reductase-like NAD-dependent aldehyde dehydrogenase|nr:aldehyde dehydrogenase family protein [Alphaproteobacteria bacterium]
MKNSNYVAGQWVEGSGSIQNINPSDTADKIAEYTSATADQFELAVQSAIQAQKEWEKVGIEKKSQILIKIGDELIHKSKDLGELLSREEGKPLAEGIGEVARAGQQFQYYGSECLRLYGEKIPSTRPGFQVEISREPLGVIGIISPWNFPIAIPAWKAAPALMCGNAVILKPASLTPASAIELTKIIANQDIPDGLFNLVLGSGGDIGHKIATHKDIVAITFTGSVEVGKKLYQDASPQLKKMQMEMGSKNPLVVMDDADLQTAIACASNGAYGGTGQKCTASSRLIVHENIYKDFVDGLIENIKNIKVGHALDEGTQMGPASNQSQYESNLNYVEIGKGEAKLAFGGNPMNMRTAGYYMEPTLFIDGDNKSRINQEEMFGPIACVIPAKDLENALEIANDTDFGLSSGIITQSLAKAEHFKQNIKTGVSTVNLPTAGLDYHVPFGGRKASSFGPREQGTYARDFYSQVKTSYINSGSI